MFKIHAWKNMEKHWWWDLVETLGHISLTIKTICCIDLPEKKEWDLTGHSLYIQFGPWNRSYTSGTIGCKRRKTTEPPPHLHRLCVSKQCGVSKGTAFRVPSVLSFQHGCGFIQNGVPDWSTVRRMKRERDGESLGQSTKDNMVRWSVSVDLEFKLNHCVYHDQGFTWFHSDDMWLACF